MKRLIHPFPPLADSLSRVLILGSFPSVISRQKQFYYANRSNRFWPVLAAVFEEEDTGDVSGRIAFAHRHHLALWDVIHSCTIQGSADAAIAHVRVNPVEEFLAHSSVCAVFTTGKKASALYEMYIHSSLPHTALPSTSGANARMTFKQLVKEYQKIRDEIEKD